MPRFGLKQLLFAVTCVGILLAGLLSDSFLFQTILASIVATAAIVGLAFTIRYKHVPVIVAELLGAAVWFVVLLPSIIGVHSGIRSEVDYWPFFAVLFMWLPGFVCGGILYRIVAGIVQPNRSRTEPPTDFANWKFAASWNVAASTALAVAAAFMLFTSQAAASLLRNDADRYPLTPACEVLCDYAQYGFVVPLVCVLLGAYCLRKGKPTGLKVLTFSAWALALGTVGFTLVAWQITFIPVFSGLK